MLLATRRRILVNSADLNPGDSCDGLFHAALQGAQVGPTAS
jgi:hypothetical protein